MASKTVLLCAFAFLAQAISGQPCNCNSDYIYLSEGYGQSCYQPYLAPPCGCNSDSVSISLSEGCGQSFYQPLSIPCPAPAPLPLPRPLTSSCGCNSDSISISLSGGSGQSCYQRLPSPALTPLPLPRPLSPSCGCNSDSVSISLSGGSGQSCYQPRPAPLPSCGCNSDSVSISISEGAQRLSRPQPLLAPCSSNRVSIGRSESGSGSYYQSAISTPSCVSIAVPDNGGAFAITSIGPIAPSGIAVDTDVGLAGDVYVSGVLPYLSAVGFEGQFATSGAAPVSYGCGNGCIAISEEIGGYSNRGAGSMNVNVVGGGVGGCGCGCGCY